MAKKPSVRELRQYLSSRQPPELLEEIVLLYTKFDAVQEHYTLLLHGGYSQELLDRYKAIITKEFFPGRGVGHGRIAVARRAVLDYKKLASAPEGIAEIMVHYVEMGVAYTRQYGDISAPFYASMESMYEAALKYIGQHRLEDQFRERCEQIMRDTHGIGWGFNDTMVELYYNLMDDDEDDDLEAE